MRNTEYLTHFSETRKFEIAISKFETLAGQANPNDPNPNQQNDSDFDHPSVVCASVMFNCQNQAQSLWETELACCPAFSGVMARGIEGTKVFGAASSEDLGAIHKFSQVHSETRYPLLNRLRI